MCGHAATSDGARVRRCLHRRIIDGTCHGRYARGTSTVPVMDGNENRHASSVDDPRSVWTRAGKRTVPWRSNRRCIVTNKIDRAVSRNLPHTGNTDGLFSVFLRTLTMTRRCLTRDVRENPLPWRDRYSSATPDSVKPRPEAAGARTGAHGNALILRHLGAWLLVTEPLVPLLGLGVCGRVLALVLGTVLGTGKRRARGGRKLAVGRRRRGRARKMSSWFRPGPGPGSRRWNGGWFRLSGSGWRGMRRHS